MSKQLRSLKNKSENTYFQTYGVQEGNIGAPRLKNGAFEVGVEMAIASKYVLFHSATIPAQFPIPKENRPKPRETKYKSIEIIHFHTLWGGIL